MENVPAATQQSGQSSNSPATTDQGDQSSSAVANTSSTSETGGFESGSKRLHPLVAGFQKLTMMRQLWLMVALAASVALGLVVVLWSQGSNYRPLMSANNNYEISDIIDILQDARIDFNMDPDSGIILVRDNQLHDARLAVAQAGLSNDQTVGMELLELSREMKARPASPSGEQSAASGMRAPQALSEFEQAQTLLEDGVAIEQLVHQTGLTRSEAELVQLLHRPQMATDFSADVHTAFR